MIKASDLYRNLTSETLTEVLAGSYSIGLAWLLWADRAHAAISLRKLKITTKNYARHSSFSPKNMFPLFSQHNKSFRGKSADGAPQLPSGVPTAFCFSRFVNNSGNQNFLSERIKREVLLRFLFSKGLAEA
jgi:hypothetical protein